MSLFSLSIFDGAYIVVLSATEKVASYCSILNFRHGRMMAGLLGGFLRWQE
jgi:hypothetical protein